MVNDRVENYFIIKEKRQKNIKINKNYKKEPNRDFKMEKHNILYKNFMGRFNNSMQAVKLKINQNKNL